MILTQKVALDAPQQYRSLQSLNCSTQAVNAHALHCAFCKERLTPNPVKDRREAGSFILWSSQFIRLRLTSVQQLQHHHITPNQQIVLPCGADLTIDDMSATLGEQGSSITKSKQLSLRESIPARRDVGMPIRRFLNQINGASVRNIIKMAVQERRGELDVFDNMIIRPSTHPCL